MESNFFLQLTSEKRVEQCCYHCCWDRMDLQNHHSQLWQFDCYLMIDCLKCLQRLPLLELRTLKMIRWIFRESKRRINQNNKENLFWSWLTLWYHVKIRRWKTEWYDQEKLSRNYEKLSRTKERIFWIRESFSITQKLITKLDESTMYISVFISLSTTLPEVNLRGKEKTASNYP